MLAQSIRFVTVGLVNTALALAAMFACMFFLNTSPAVANVLGYSVGFIVSFLLNRSWTFERSGTADRSLPRFALVCGVSYALNFIAVTAAVAHPAADPYLAQMLGAGIYTVCSFFGCRWFVFAPRQGSTRSASNAKL